MAEWPDPESPDSLVSFRAFANFLRELIPEFHKHTKEVKAYMKKGTPIA